MSRNKSAQVDFIKQIRLLIPPHHNLVDELADVLQVSNDSAYRRIRGETALTMDEIILLCNHYRISFDSFNINNPGTVTFNYQPLGNDEKSFEHYLKNMHSDLKKISGFDNKHLYFAAEDIPIFHHFYFPYLTSFKIFYWNRSILNMPELEGKKFEPGYVPSQMLKVAEEILDLYSNISSVEIWCEDTLNSTLKQIEFYWDTQIIRSSGDAMQLCDELELMIKRIQLQSEQGCKMNKKNECIKGTTFELYNTDLMIGNNCILVSMNDVKGVYLTHQTFNAMITTNVAFCDETENWFKNLMKKSPRIDGQDKERSEKFFNGLYERLERVKAKLSR
jgi:hypothetical protein